MGCRMPVFPSYSLLVAMQRGGTKAEPRQITRCFTVLPYLMTWPVNPLIVIFIVNIGPSIPVGETLEYVHLMLT